MVLRRIARFASVLAAVFVIGSIVFASATLAEGGTTPRSTTTISIGGLVHLGSGPSGPGASVSITYSCFPGFGGKGGYGGGSFGNVSLTDLSGHQGFQGFSATCDDKKHGTIVFVSGFFNPGAGAVSAFLCGFDCSSTSKEVKIG